MSAPVDIYIGFSLLVFIMLTLLDFRGYSRVSGQEAAERRYIGLGKGYHPKVLVIVPCRGKDLTLYENLLSMKEQDYKRFEVIAVVDTANDASVASIKRAKIGWMVSNVKAEAASGKVRAILSALQKYKDHDVYVIADSDITVDGLWLRRLVEPLADYRIGLSTMFPYFKPVGGFWSRIKLLWGFIGEGLMEGEATRFGWGGSMAFRKDMLNKGALDFLKNSRYSVSDDVCLTKIVKQRGLKIAYTRMSQPIVKSDDGYSKFVEWSNRQTALSILGYRKNLYLGLLFYGAEIWNLLSAIILSLLVSPLFLVFFLHPIQSEIKTYPRARGKSKLMWLLVPLMSIVYFANLVTATATKEITWRGRRYRLAA
ncbi:MAG: glycosyltransferase [Candidatus Micrarchaeota archaeon]|nr:glycosyltransferase [Candidatus Micrarchaeota archaeon]